MPDADLRRVDDRRIEQLDRKITKVASDVGSIRDMLISEPAASPLGRALLEKSTENRRIIDRHHDEFQAFVRDDFQPLDDWWNQSRGAWKFILGAGTVLGIVGAVFGVASFFGLGQVVPT
jgi:hypothetical protein